MPPDSFRDRILTLVRQIPYGRVATYGQLAALAGAPRRARQVGHILRHAEDPMLPWHRVINHRGRISLPHGAGYEVQKQLLLQEHIEFDADDCIDLDRFGWRPAFH